MKVGSLLREPIDVRRLHVRMSVATEITPAPVVREDEKNVGLLCRVRCDCTKRCDAQDQASDHPDNDSSDKTDVGLGPLGSVQGGRRHEPQGRKQKMGDLIQL